MDNIYNAIQNLYNMDKTTWQEVLAELYNLVSNIENKFDLFEIKFGSLLGEQVIRELKKMYDDGSLASLINDVLLQDINEKVDTFKTEVSEQLDTIESKDYHYIELKNVLNKVTDFSTVINNIISKCQNDKKYKIVIPEGDFIINTPINIISNIEIVGSGRKGTILWGNVNNDEYCIKYSSDIDNIFISNLTLKPLTEKNKLINGVDFGNCRYSGFNKCCILNFNVGVNYLGKCWGNLIENNQFWNNTITIKFNRIDAILEANHFNILKNEFYDSDYGVYYIGGRSINISNNIFERVNVCVNASYEVRPLSFTHNYLEGIEKLLEVSSTDGTKKFIVNANYIHGYNKNNKRLIDIQEVTGDPTRKYLTISNNYFNENLGLKELISVKDNYSIDFYGNCFNSYNPYKNYYYNELFTNDSLKPYTRTKAYKGFNTDLKIIDISSGFSADNWLNTNRHFEAYVLSNNNIDTVGSLRVIISAWVGSTFTNLITIPSDITPYETIRRTGSVIYTDDSVDLIQVLIRSDYKIELKGYSTSKTIKCVNIDVSYSNYLNR